MTTKEIKWTFLPVMIPYLNKEIFKKIVNFQVRANKIPYGLSDLS